MNQLNSWFYTVGREREVCVHLFLIDAHAQDRSLCPITTDRGGGANQCKPITTEQGGGADQCEPITDIEGCGVDSRPTITGGEKRERYCKHVQTPTVVGFESTGLNMNFYDTIFLECSDNDNLNIFFKNYSVW